MMKKLLNALLVLALIFSSCNKDDNKLDFKPVEAGMNGFVQKGPFISGSSITVQELDNTFTPNGKTYNTTTNDDFGSFKLKSVIGSPYVEVIAQGFYFNEVSGDLSSANLTLRALLKTSGTMAANVNILTTLSEQRIIYLTQEKGRSFDEAQRQAEAEILKVFGITDEGLAGFNQMDISKEGKSNAVLLAISSILQGYHSVAELSELISKIILDIKEDGTVEDSKITFQLKMNATILNLFSIRGNLENRFSQLGLDITVPEFESYAKRLVPLTVTKTTPMANDKKVPVNVSISLLFNKPLELSSVTANAIRVTNGNEVVPGTFTYTARSYEVVFKPTNVLIPSTSYTVTLNNNLKGLDGLPLSENYSIGFVTESLDIASNLTNYYKFTGNFADLSGNSRSALPTGVTFTSDRTNVANNAIQFSGNNNYIDVPRAFDPVNSEWTCSIWFKLDQLPSVRAATQKYADAMLLTRQKDDGECDIYLYVDDADDMIKTGIVSSHKKLSSGVAVTKDQWINATMTYSASALSIYVNGELKVTSFDRFTLHMQDNEPFRIASMFNGWWGDAYDEGRIYGAIDDLRIYQRCLNANEVKQLFGVENTTNIKSAQLPMNARPGVAGNVSNSKSWY